MAFQVSVIIHYEFPGIGVNRSWGFTIDQETPVTRADIQAEVDAVALDLIRQENYPELQRFAIQPTYTWEVESVFEF